MRNSSVQIHKTYWGRQLDHLVSLAFFSSSKLTEPLDQLGLEASEAKTTKLFRPRPSQPQPQPLLMGNAWVFCLKRWYMKIRKTWKTRHCQCLMKLKSPWLKYCMKRRLLLLTVVMGMETRPPLRSLTLPMLPIMGRFMRLTSRKKERKVRLTRTLLWSVTTFTTPLRTNRHLVYTVQFYLNFCCVVSLMSFLFFVDSEVLWIFSFIWKTF